MLGTLVNTGAILFRSLLGLLEPQGPGLAPERQPERQPEPRPERLSGWPRR